MAAKKKASKQKITIEITAGQASKLAKIAGKNGDTAKIAARALGKGLAKAKIKTTTIKKTKITWDK